MSAQRVTTHVVESEPLFITFSHQQTWFETQFVGGGILWHHVTIEEKFDTPISELLQEAHKIVVDVAGCSADEREALITLLSPHQQKLKIILPIYSFWQLHIPGEIPGWQIASDWQASQIFHWSSRLSDSSIIFVRDVIDWLPPTLFTGLLTQSLTAELLFEPDGKISLCEKKSLITLLSDEIGAPSRGSLLIQTKEFSLNSLFEQCVPLYGSMYRSWPHLQQVRIAGLQLLPFPCRVREISQSLNMAVNLAVYMLPSPTDYPQLETVVQKDLGRCQADPWFSPRTTVENVALHHQNQQQAPLVDEQKEVRSTPTINNETTSVAPESSQGINNLGQTEASTWIVMPSPVIPSPEVLEVEKERQLKEDVKKIFSSQGIKQHTVVIQQKSKQRKIVKKRSRKRTAVFYIGLFFVASGLVIAATLGSLQVTQQLVGREFSRIGMSISESGGTPTETLRWGNLPVLLNVMNVQHGVLSSIFSLPLLDTSNSMLTLRNQLQSALQLREKMIKNNQLLYAIISGQSQDSITDVTKQFSDDAAAALQLSAELSATILQLPEPMNQSLASAAAKLLPTQASKKSELIATVLVPRLASLSGAEGQRRYAVVLQNSQELRPTGGFIEAIALLTFDRGSLSDQKVYSIYTLDSMLPYQSKPPLDLTATTGENQWWPHDANWYADPTKSAAQISSFLEATLQQKTDGVLFLNTAGLPQLLKTLGPLEMADYSEILTEKNIAERLEFHNELPSQVIPGKADYRQALLTQLIHKLRSLSPEQVPALNQILATLLEEKQIIATFISAEDQQLFRQLGWAGDMAFPVCPAAYVAGGCVSDGIALVESNVGFNRSNAYIDRTQTHKAVLSTSGVRHERKIQYTNTATSNAWPKGDYKLYLRAYMPGRPTNISVTFDNTTLSAKEVTVRDTEIGAEVALLVTVPVGSTKELILSYDQIEPLSPTSTYVFYENRQAGLTGPVPSFNLVHPQDWRVTSRVPEAMPIGSQLQFPESTAPYLMRVVQFTPAQ